MTIMGDFVPMVQKKRFIESSSFYTNKASKNPFSEMKIDDTSFLEDVPCRSPCPKCNKSRKYYCYTCYVAVKEVASRLPVIDLPVQIDIIKHPKEVDGKSTSAHAAVLAPRDVTIYTYPNFPAYENEKVLLVFPGKSAIPFEKWWLENISLAKNSREEDSVCDSNVPKPDVIKKIELPFSRVVFIDSTWRQSKALYNDIRIKTLPCVMLSSHRSLFWRYCRGKKESHLSTVEALYYFLVELHTYSRPEPYAGQYDNLLFFFQFMYFKIRELYDPATLKAYRRSERTSS